MKVETSMEEWVGDADRKWMVEARDSSGEVWWM